MIFLIKTAATFDSDYYVKNVRATIMSLSGGH